MGRGSVSLSTGVGLHTLSWPLVTMALYTPHSNPYTVPHTHVNTPRHIHKVGRQGEHVPGSTLLYKHAAVVTGKAASIHHHHEEHDLQTQQATTDFISAKLLNFLSRPQNVQILMGIQLKKQNCLQQIHIHKCKSLLHKVMLRWT